MTLELENNLKEEAKTSRQFFELTWFKLNEEFNLVGQRELVSTYSILLKKYGFQPFQFVTLFKKDGIWDDDERIVEFHEWFEEHVKIGMLQALSKSQAEKILQGENETGRPINKMSLRQQCFRLFDEGLTAGEVAKKFEFPSNSKYYRQVMVYYAQWKGDNK